jgi:hypothetical protein
MSGNASCEPLWPAHVCSFGSCVNGTCECDAGWLSVGDFAPTAGLDCGIHQTFIQVLFGLLAFAHLTVLVRAAPNTLNVLRNYGRNRPTVALIYASLNISSLCFIICGCLKVSDPERNSIGAGALYTVIWCVGMSWFFIAVPNYVMLQIAYLRTAAKTAAESRRVRINALVNRVSKMIAYVVTPGAVLACNAPILILADPGRVAVFAALHYIGILPVIMALYFVAVRPSIEWMLDDFAASDGSPAVLKAKKKLLWLNEEGFRQVISNIVTASMMGLWPFFTSKATYQLGVVWLGASVLGHIVVTMITVKPPSGSGKRSSTSAVSSAALNSSVDSSPSSGRASIVATVAQMARRFSTAVAPAQ